MVSSKNYLDTCDFILREGRGFDKEDYKNREKWHS